MRIKILVLFITLCTITLLSAAAEPEEFTTNDFIAICHQMEDVLSSGCVIGWSKDSKKAAWLHWIEPNEPLGEVAEVNLAIIDLVTDKALHRSKFYEYPDCNINAIEKAVAALKHHRIVRAPTTASPFPINIGDDILTFKLDKNGNIVLQYGRSKKVKKLEYRTNDPSRVAVNAAYKSPFGDRILIEVFLSGANDQTGITEFAPENDVVGCHLTYGFK